MLFEIKFYGKRKMTGLNQDIRVQTVMVTFALVI